ncbi:Wpp domain-containing protein, partial [Thalictrum thalictroides]
EQQQHQETKPEETSETEITKKFDKMNISLSIWPPTQRTRDAVINRLIETLAAPSILSKRYGSLSTEEASIAAKSIEEEAFVIACKTVTVEEEQQTSSTNKEDDGIEILQIYSKEISKRMLEVVKAKALVSTSSSSPSPVAVVESNDSAAVPAPAAASETKKSCEMQLMIKNCKHGA